MKQRTIITSITIIFLISIVFLPGCVEQRETLLHDGLERHYLLHLPESYDETISYPLVVVFHGGGGNAENIQETTNFSKKADEEGFIVVYPEGKGKLPYKLLTWNCGFCCGYALENNIDDVGYIRALVDHLEQTYSIDLKRIYATGISNGGIMSYQVGAALSDIFAAIAPVAAQIGGQASEAEKLWRIPEPKFPVSVLAFNGMNDSRVPYEGGRPSDNDTHVYSWMSTNQSISFWVQQNDCNAFPKRNVSESGNIIIDIHSGGMNQTEVHLVTIVNGTHSWPGGQKGWKNGAEPCKEISATDMIWDFFKTHPKT